MQPSRRHYKWPFNWSCAQRQVAAEARSSLFCLYALACMPFRPFARGHRTHTQSGCPCDERRQQRTATYLRSDRAGQIRVRAFMSTMCLMIITLVLCTSTRACAESTHEHGCTQKRARRGDLLYCLHIDEAIVRSTRPNTEKNTIHLRKNITFLSDDLKFVITQVLVKLEQQTQI